MVEYYSDGKVNGKPFVNPRPPTARQAAEIAMEISKATDAGAPKDVGPLKPGDDIAALRWAMRENHKMFGANSVSLNQAHLRTIRGLQNDPNWKKY